MNANVFSIGDEDDDVEYGTYIFACVYHNVYICVHTYIRMYGLSRCTGYTYVCICACMYCVCRYTV